jgi:hypothetical protein
MRKPDVSEGAWFRNSAETSRLLRTIAAFLERQGKVPPELLEPLRASPGSGEQTAPAPETPATDGNAREPSDGRLFPEARPTS